MQVPSRLGLGIVPILSFKTRIVGFAKLYILCFEFRYRTYAQGKVQELRPSYYLKRTS